MKELEKEELAALKVKHGRVFAVKLKNKATDIVTGVVYFRSPSLAELECSTVATEGGKKPLAFNKMLIKICQIGGDIVENTDDFFAVGEILDKIVSNKTAELEEY